MKSDKPVAKFESNKIILDKSHNAMYVNLKNIDNGGIIKNLISKEEITTLLNIYEQQKKIPVGLDGIVSHYKEGDMICSYRATLFSKDLANQIFSRIREFIPVVNGWEPLGINESFRYIDYVREGVLIPHYDGGYTDGEGNTSFITLVIYLIQGEDGQTEFIREYRENNADDWDRMANEDEIIETANTKNGDALLFPHHTLHQGAKTSSRKVIIRTDIMYRKIK